jgi:hypothetical protein
LLTQIGSLTALLSVNDMESNYAEGLLLLLLLLLSSLLL